MKIEISEKTFEVVYDALIERIAELSTMHKGRKAPVELTEDKEAMLELVRIDQQLHPERWLGFLDERQWKEV